ncbi:MAG: hypothetical protein HC801_02365 [Nitrospira sp.]|nr:hypothetical protein [Nitrospira sp.]
MFFPQEGDSLAPADASAADDKDTSSFRIRRARIKVGGHGFVPWLKYYVEYDWLSNTLLDYRLDIAKFKWATLRVGQWKIDYNRERVDSSGAQQFVERSIVNAPFTLDRQIGARLGGASLRRDLCLFGIQHWNLYRHGNQQSPQ